MTRVSCGAEKFRTLAYIILHNSFEDSEKDACGDSGEDSLTIPVNKVRIEVRIQMVIHLKIHLEEDSDVDSENDSFEDS